MKEIGKKASNIFNDPIKGFGVLSGYAQKRIGRLTTFGRDRIDGANKCLSEEVKIYEHYTLELARQAEGVLKHFGKDIIGKQFTSKRFANAAIDLFVGLCTLSRVSTMIDETSEEKCADEIAILQIFTQQAKRRMNQNLRRLKRNEDSLLKKLADRVFADGKYRWDSM